jgi:hypothetical protein
MTDMPVGRPFASGLSASTVLIRRSRKMVQYFAKHFEKLHSISITVHSKPFHRMRQVVASYSTDSPFNGIRYLWKEVSITA